LNGRSVDASPGASGTTKTLAQSLVADAGVTIYMPPSLSSLGVYSSPPPPPVVRDRLVIGEFPAGQITTVWINIMQQGLSDWIRVPVIVARGFQDGIVVGITAAVHGNELNGVPCIHEVMREIDVSTLKGTVVAVPCVNTPGYLSFQREFSDGKDLNRAFPGQADGVASKVFAHHMLEKIINCFNYHIDLHTASFGRVNSYYVRADMNNEHTAMMAKLQKPQIILHNSGQDGTLRGTCMQRSINSITVEIGNPQQFQNQFVMWSYSGVMNILSHLKMHTQNDHRSSLYSSSDEIGTPTQSQSGTNLFEKPQTDFTPPTKPVICSKGFWMYTKTGGVLEVFPPVNTFVNSGVLIAVIKNIFGNIVDEYFSPCDGMVIGRSSNPVAMAGDRIIHLGVPLRKNEVLPAVAKENY